MDDYKEEDYWEDGENNDFYYDENENEKGDYCLVGIDGNAFSIMGYVQSCMRKEGKTVEERKEYTDKAMEGNYDNLLCVSQEMIEELNDNK